MMAQRRTFWLLLCRLLRFRNGEQVSSFVGSPVWGAVITVVGTIALSIFALIARLIGKVNRVSDKMDGIASDIEEIKNDKDTVRWSELARRRGRGKRDVL